MYLAETFTIQHFAIRRYIHSREHIHIWVSRLLFLFPTIPDHSKRMLYFWIWIHLVRVLTESFHRKLLLLFTTGFPVLPLFVIITPKEHKPRKWKKRQHLSKQKYSQYPAGWQRWYHLPCHRSKPMDYHRMKIIIHIRHDAVSGSSVSYTHLTLPTKRIV